MSSRIASLIVLLAASLMLMGCPSDGGVSGNGDGTGEGMSEGFGEGGPEGDGESEREIDTIMLPGDIPLEMVSIPAGTFMMGRYPGEGESNSDEDPQHEVTLSSGFWLSKYEVTKAQWEAVMGTAPWAGEDWSWDDPNSPAVYVSWDDAQVFITELSVQTGESFRLPSEAEWEYACRAGTTTRYSYGDDPYYFGLGSYAWWVGNAWSAGERYAHVVGQKLPNPWGLYDMHGNVWEWCQDWYHGGYAGAPADGSAWESPADHYRVHRGGGWDNSGDYSRSAYRNGDYPDGVHYSVGFRLARD